MEEKTPIPYKENDSLIQGEKYLSECGIEFTYNPIESNEKPYVLNNGVRLDHIPIKKDTGTNNLITNMMISKEEIVQRASNGGKKAQEIYKKRRTFKESLEMFLSLDISQEQLERIDSRIVDKIPEELRKELTQGDLINLKQLELSQDGSDKASVFVRDTIGEKPTERHEIEAEVMTDADRVLLDKISKRLQGV